MSQMVIAAVRVEPDEFLAVVATAAVAGTLSALATGRGLLSTLVYPILGLCLRGDAPVEAPVAIEVPSLAGGAG